MKTELNLRGAALHPLPRCRNYFRKRAFSLPSQHGFGAAGVGYQSRWISRPARTQLFSNRSAGYSLDRRHYLVHGMAAAGAQIQRNRVSSAEQVLKRLDVSFRQVGDVHIIANASAIRGWIIGSKHLQGWTLVRGGA